ILWTDTFNRRFKFEKRCQLVDKREKRGSTAASGQLHYRVNRPDGKRRHVIRVYNFSFARNHKASRAVIHFPEQVNRQRARMEREVSWWRKYVFSTDHKVIGIQYAISGLVFLFFGFCLGGPFGHAAPLVILASENPVKIGLRRPEERASNEVCPVGSTFTIRP